MTSPRTQVMIVDDEDDMRTVLSGVLRRAKYEVVAVNNGREALGRIARRRPDLVLLDVEMPLMNGWQVLTKIKSDVLMRHLPVLMLTCKATIPSKVQGLNLGANDYITKPFDPRELLARVKGAFQTVRTDVEANPLSLLPGNHSIERELEKRMRSAEKFAVLYADLNNFKALNDRYGFDRGDKVIRRVADMLTAARQPGDFVGHVGGDDFIIVTTPKRSEEMCRKIIADLSAFAPNLYDPADRRNGGIEVCDRSGRKMRFPFVGIAIGGVTNLQQPLTSIGQISALGAEMKKFAKRDPKGYAFDQRINVK